MKKLSLTASAFQKGEVLSRAQLKKVLGGDGSGDGGEFGTCTVTVHCGTAPSSSTISCTGQAGKCKHEEPGLGLKGYVQCDNDPKVTC